MPLLTITDSDEPAYISQIETILSRVTVDYEPSSFIVVKIDNWFGDRWLEFSGKILGAVGARSHKTPTLPPFVPNRVISQHEFMLSPEGFVATSNPTPPLHRKQPSEQNLKRKLADVAPGSAIAWYSDRSKSTGQGALMCSVPHGDAYWNWYAGFSEEKHWAPTKCVGITIQELDQLEAGSL
jgi:hypothetical protein